MRVLFVNSFYGEKSAGILVKSLFFDFSNKNVEAKVAYGRSSFSKEDNKNVIRICSKAELYLHALFTRLTGFSWFGGSYLSTFRLIRLIKSFRPDVINIHIFHGYYLNEKLLFAYLKKIKIPTVLTLHDFTAFTGKCGNPVSCTKYYKKCEKCIQKSGYPKSLFFDQSSREFSSKKAIFSNFKTLHFVCVSEWLSDQIKKSGIFPSSEILIIPNGVDCSIFKPTSPDFSMIPSRFPRTKIVMVVCTRFDDPIKGPDSLASVINNLERLDKEAVFVLVGGNVDSIMKKITSTNVIPIGEVHNPRLMASLYNAASIFFLPSLRETFSVPTTESLCCGTPVIGFCGVGGPETIVPAGCGAFLRTRDGLFAAQFLQNCLQKSPFLSREECSLVCSSRFSKEKMFSSYYSLFTSLLDKNN